MEWQAYGSLVAIIFIGFMLIVPSRRARKQFKYNQSVRSRKVEFKAKQSPVSLAPVIGVNGITAMRGDSTHHLTGIKPIVIFFPGIEKGFFSETVYVVVDINGNITQHSTEDQAQNTYKKGDYGISAITMSKGLIQTRDIKPNTVHADNAFKLIINMVLSTR